MADVKISELTALTSPDGAEELVVNDGGTTKKITITNATSASLARSGGTMTGVIAGFESTGIDDNATSTAITIDSSENVGIGTAPSVPLHVKKAGSTSAVQEFIRLENNATGGTGAGSSMNFHHYHAGSGPAGGAKAASITVVNSGSWAAGTPSSYSTDLTFGTIHENTFGERLRIDSSGKVGIGTSSPAQLLEIKGGSNTSLRLHSDTESSAVPAIEMMRGTNDTFGADAYTDWRMKVTSGELVIESAEAGTTTDRLRIHYNGTVDIKDPDGYGMRVYSPAGSNGGRTDQNRDTDGAITAYYKDNSYKGGIDITSTAVSYTSISDYRLKENVIPITGAVARVKLLKPSQFNFITDAAKTVDGFIAHEAQEVVPEAVTGTKDAMRDEEYEVTPATDTEAAVMGTRSVPDLQGIDQAKLVPLLTATIQELIARIEALEA